MSEPIPESIPTSYTRPSNRPAKKLQLSHPSSKACSNPAIASQAALLDTLFANPDRPVVMPLSATRNGYLPTVLPPEIVANVQGSSAGAGSGEFHVYKASRRREYERLRRMDEEVREEKEDEEWEKNRRENEQRDAERTQKKRRKRVRGKKGGGSEQMIGSNVMVRSTLPDAAGNVEGRDDGEGEGEDVVVAVAVEEEGVIIHDDD